MVFSSKGVGEPIGPSLIIEAFGNIADMYPNLAGEYEKVDKGDEPGTVWQHSQHSALSFGTTGLIWRIQKNATDIARAPRTAMNLNSSVEWRFYKSSTNEWIEGFVDVYIDLSPDDDPDAESESASLTT